MATISWLSWTWLGFLGLSLLGLLLALLWEYGPSKKVDGAGGWMLFGWLMLSGYVALALSAVTLIAQLVRWLF